MIPNLRSTAARSNSSFKYVSRSFPAVNTRMLSAAFAISQRNALASRCIEHLLLLGDALEKIRIPNGPILHKVNRPLQECRERVSQGEIVLHPYRNRDRLKLHKEISVAAEGIEVAPHNRPKRRQPAHAVLTT